MTFVESIKGIAQNLVGWRTNRKIVVIESDDWGSVRMPSLRALEHLRRLDVIGTSGYDFLDTLESSKDLDLLFNALSEIRNSSGLPPKITFNCVLGNPDFQKIRASGFNEYFHETFLETYDRLGLNSLKHWEDGIAAGLMKPQYHSREHLHVASWLQALRSGEQRVRLAFDSEYFSVRTPSSEKSRSFLAAHYVADKAQLDQLEKITADGLNLFEAIFGFESKSFIACNYTWPRQLEGFLARHGIRYIQGQRAQLSCEPGAASPRVIRHYTGQRNIHGQLYLVRNCHFEPSLNPKVDVVSSCLRQIEIAFMMNRPAVISSHRANFVGGLVKENRSRNLTQLSSLLKQVVMKWPQVEFVSSDELGDLIDDA